MFSLSVTKESTVDKANVVDVEAKDDVDSSSQSVWVDDAEVEDNVDEVDDEVDDGDTYPNLINVINFINLINIILHLSIINPN